MTERVEQREWVGFSPARIATVAFNTFTEAARQKVFNILLVFALVVIASALFFRQFSMSSASEHLEQFKFVKDFCLGAISVFGTFIAIVGTAQLLPNEVETRTIYTILAKPVRRVEFLLGKFSGSVLLIGLSTVLMSVMFAAVLWVMLVFAQGRVQAEAGLANAAVSSPAVQDTLRQIHAAAADPDLVKGVLLIVMKLVVLAAITLLVSTFSTSMVFNVVLTFLVFFAGHMVGTAREMWGEHEAVRWLLSVIPDLGLFNVADDIILGNAIPWLHVAKVAVYGAVFTLGVVGAAHLIFANREI